MSYHDSAKTMYTYKEIIPVFLGDFVTDFDCSDVEDRLRMILSKEEMDVIVKSEKYNQVYRLFWTLREQPDSIVEKFVEDVLKDDAETRCYGFLMFPIQEEQKQPSQDTRLYISEIDNLHNNNQRFSKYNVSRMRPYIQLMKALLELRPAKNVLIDGVLGAGKQWLALDVCSSYAVQLQMGFKIFWLNVRDCHTPEKDLEMLQYLLHQIDPNLRSTCEHSNGWGILQRIDYVKAELRRLLKCKPYKNCLVVLRNVQNVKTWKAFNLGCKVLLTTRYKRVTDYLSSATTTRVQLSEALTPFEVESLFCKYLCCKRVDLPIEPYKTDTMYSNPRILSIIAESIRDGLATWNNWEHVNSNKLTTIIESSIAVLEPKYRKQYEKLFIFPESAHIPFTLLDLIWSMDASAYEVNPVIFINKLHKFSLVEKHSDELTVTLPSIYMELRLTVDNEADLHKIIVDSYNIPMVFDQYNDTNLSNLDDYFYSHIGHHLSRLKTDDRVTLFRKVFLDFRFLDHKIRRDTTIWNASGSILNTLQQLKFYSSHIIDDSPHYKALVKALVDFLPKVEEQLIRSEYTCLLLIALMAEEGAVYKEAYEQVLRFPEHVWFTEHGRFHQHRQIINLGMHQVKHAIYLDDDFCLMALDNQQVLLTDVSLEAETTYLLSDQSDLSEIIEMKVFNHQRHLLTLHNNGSLKLWSLWTDSCGRPLLPRRRSSGSRQRVRPHRLAHLPRNAPTRCHKQLVNDVIKGFMGPSLDKKISAFCLDEEARMPNTNLQLHVALVNGDVCVIDWDAGEQEFKPSHTPVLKTNQSQVRCFSKVLGRFYVLSTSDCFVTIWDLRSSCKERELQLGRGLSSNAALAMDVYVEQLDNDVNYTTLLLISTENVWRVRFEHVFYQQIDNLQPELLPFRDTNIGTITCAKRSTDGRYLILGTKSKGLIVYDLKLSDSVLRSNVSQHIACVDIYELNEDIFKYIVLCGAVGNNLLHIHTLRQNGMGNYNAAAITWMHSVDKTYVESTNDSSHACFEPNVYLRPLFDMSDSQLFAVDSKQRVHQIKTDFDNVQRRSSGDLWSTITPTHGAKQHRITMLCAYEGAQIYAGYENGVIVDVNFDIVLPQDFIDEPIDFMKQVNANTLVASSRNARKTVIFELSTARAQSTNTQSSEQNPWPLQLPVDTMYACLFSVHYLLLFHDHGVCRVNLLQPTQLLVLVNVDEPVVGFDMQDVLLFLALQDKSIKIYQLTNSEQKIGCKEICNDKIKQQADINYLKATCDGSIFAIGFNTGIIEVYTTSESSIKLIYSMEKVQKRPIRQMRFSPCKQLLVSCAENLCFWSVTHMRNNQLDSKMPTRRSRRNKSSGKSEEEVDALPFVRRDSVEQITAVQPVTPQELPHIKVSDKGSAWRDKRGNAVMPALLACIKFVGNEACQFFSNTDFTQFYVIDDEGVYHHLKLLQSQEQPMLDPIAMLPALDYENFGERISMDVLPPLETGHADDSGFDVVGNTMEPTRHNDNDDATVGLSI